MKKRVLALMFAAWMMCAASASAGGVLVLPGATRIDGDAIVVNPRKQGVQVQTEETAGPAPTVTPKPTATPKPETAAQKVRREKEEAKAAAQEAGLKLTEEYRWFVSSYKAVRGRTILYYDNVYAYNHGKYYMTPFSYNLDPEYIVKDSTGAYAVAPIVLDITDAMREALYGGDLGEVSMVYGQYCERIVGTKGREGFSGIHEGIDFTHEPGAQLYTIMDGEVTRAGDRNGTVAVYNEDYDITLLYLHCENIIVRRGDYLLAGDPIAKEGKKGISGNNTYYTHVEMREGRHTTTNPYRNAIQESMCPYPIMEAVLEIVESGRQPVTAAAVLEAQRMREEAEAAAREAEEEAAREEEEEILSLIELIDTTSGGEAGYGFDSTVVVPEATLPPSK